MLPDTTICMYLDLGLAQKYIGLCFVVAEFNYMNTNHLKGTMCKILDIFHHLVVGLRNSHVVIPQVSKM